MLAARILCKNLAGLRSQALGLVEAAGIAPDLRVLELRGVWRHLSPAFWVNPRWAVAGGAVAEPLPGLIITAGGAGARVGAALRRPGVRVVAIENPRMDLRKFDLVLAGRHDGLRGDNVIVTRTALHRVNTARLAAEAARWAPVFAGLPGKRVAVLLGGSNGRYRFGAEEAGRLAAALARMMDADGVSLMVTPSRRTGEEAMEILRAALAPRGAWIWDGSGENPFFGMLALADAVVVTADSVSMVSEAVATSAPVLLARLPGRSRRIGAFMDALVTEGRARNFAGRLELWDAEPLNDTAMAAAEMRRRLGI